MPDYSKRIRILDCSAREDAYSWSTILVRLGWRYRNHGRKTSCSPSRTNESWPCSLRWDVGVQPHQWSHSEIGSSFSITNTGRNTFVRSTPIGQFLSPSLMMIVRFFFFRDVVERELRVQLRHAGVSWDNAINYIDEFVDYPHRNRYLDIVYKYRACILPLLHYLWYLKSVLYSVVPRLLIYSLSFFLLPSLESILPTLCCVLMNK